jgi:hypothetical protein
VNPAAPSAPSNLSAMASGSSQINLAWTASTTTGVTYDVYQSAPSGIYCVRIYPDRQRRNHDELFGRPTDRFDNVLLPRERRERRWRIRRYESSERNHRGRAGLSCKLQRVEPMAGWLRRHLFDPERGQRGDY